MEFDHIVNTQSIGRLVYLNPFYDYSSLFQPTVWHNALRWCHLPGTLVEFGNQCVIEIENLFTQDTVIAEYDEVGTVTNLIRRDYSGSICSIRAYGLPPLRVTPDHEIFVVEDLEDGFIVLPASKIRPGMWLVCPKWVRNDDSYWGGILSLQKYFKQLHSADLLTTVNYLFRTFGKPLEDGSLILQADDLHMLHSLARQIIYGVYKALDLWNVPCSWQQDAVILHPDLAGFIDEAFSSRLTEASDNITHSNAYTFRKVISTEQLEYSGPVYSITVEPQHSYVADGVLVKNCEYIVMTNGILRSAIDRVVSLFITDVEIEGTDDQSRKLYKDYLYDTLGIQEKLRILGMDYITYGNFFVSFIQPVNRVLICPRCGYSESAYHGLAERRFSLNNYQYNGTCRQCKYNGVFTIKDNTIKDPNQFRLKRWRVYEMVIEWDPYTDAIDYVWKIPEYYKNAINTQEPIVLANIPKEVLDALREGKSFKFYPDAIYHGKEETLNGILMRGWGLSRVFSCLRHAWYFQVLHRMNEAIGLDYIMPLRVITPLPRPGIEGGGDPLLLRNMGAFTQTILNILEQRRLDPTVWHVSAFPLDYKTLGGDGRVLAPRDLMEQSIDTLLGSMNIPIELYRGSIRLEAAPLSLKLMEASWSHLIRVINRFLSWLADQLAAKLEWDKVKIKLVRPTIGEDINNMLMRLRLMSEGRISQTTAFQGLGLDAQEESRRILEEQIELARQTRDAQRKLMELDAGQQLVQQVQALSQAAAAQAQEAGGGPPPPAAAMAAVGGGTSAGAAPAAGLPGDPVTQILASLPVSSLQSVNPAELDQLATAVAQQLFGQPETVRSSVLRQLKTRNEILWMSVKSKLEDMYNSARRQGVIAAQQQQAAMMSQQIQPPIR